MSSDLNALTDALNAAFRRAEKAIENAGHSVAAWVPMTEDALLGFTKMDGDWRLAVKKTSDALPTYLVHASRRTRVEAAAHLNALLTAIRKQTIDEVECVRDALVTVNQFVKDNER